MFGFDSNSGQEHVTELIERLKSNVNLSDEQAQKVMETIKKLCVGKIPDAFRCRRKHFRQIIKLVENFESRFGGIFLFHATARENQMRLFRYF